MRSRAALTADRVAARAMCGSRGARVISCVLAYPRGLVGRMLGAALLLQCAGCLVGPDFSSPSAPIAEKWLEANNPSVKFALPVVSGRREDWEWWGVFHDPVLDRLIRIAYEQNLSLVSAGTRVGSMGKGRSVAGRDQCGAMASSCGFASRKTTRPFFM